MDMEEIRVYFKVPVRCLACIYKVVRLCGILFWFYATISEFHVEHTGVIN